MSLMSLEAFRRAIGWNPFHFWGLANASVPVTSKCNDVIKQYNWQSSDAIGRTEMLDAIERAETKLQSWLGYAVGARWATVDFLQWPSFYANGYKPWYAGSVQMPYEGYIASFGVETRTLIEAGATITYSDEDGDGLDDTYTLAVATAVTTPAQIAIFVPAANQVENRTLNGETWRIIPTRIMVAGGVATIVGPAWTLVDPMLYEGVSTDEALDPSDPTTFLATLDVYQVTTGGSHGAVYYDFAPYPYWCCPPSSADPAAISTTDIRAGVINPLIGTVNPVVSVYDSGSSSWSAASICGDCRAPDRLSVNVYAGYPRAANGDLDPMWQQIVARLAMAEIQGEPCGCDTANHTWAYWQQDVSRTTGPDQYAFKETALNNPLGVKRGHIEAWREIERRRHVQAVRV